MPTYGYECLDCAHQFEIVQGIKDDPLKTCDKCGGSLRKRIYPVGIAFKGSGFYVNDYASKPAAKSTSSESAMLATDGAAKAPEPATPAAKTETAPKTESTASAS